MPDFDFDDDEGMGAPDPDDLLDSDPTPLDEVVPEEAEVPGDVPDHDPDVPDAEPEPEPEDDVPADGPPPEITPDTGAQARQARINYERLVEDNATAFAADARARYIEAALAGHDIQIVVIDHNADDAVVGDDDDGEIALPVDTE